jgi:hypothetical protein
MVSALRRAGLGRSVRIRGFAAVLALLLAVVPTTLAWQAVAGERNEPSRLGLASVQDRAPGDGDPQDLGRVVERPPSPISLRRSASPGWRARAIRATVAVAASGGTGSLAFFAVLALMRRRTPDQEGSEQVEGFQVPAPTRNQPAGAMPSPDARSGAAAVENPRQAVGHEPNDRDRSEVASKVAPGSGPDASLVTHPSLTDPQPATTGADTSPTRATKVVLFDRRLEQRVPFTSHARLQWDGHDVAATTMDLSLSGVGCRLADDRAPGGPDVGTTIRVTLPLEGTLGVFQARVQRAYVHNGQAAFGLQFLQLQDVNRALLESVILQGSR